MHNRHNDRHNWVIDALVAAQGLRALFECDRLASDAPTGPRELRAGRAAPRDEQAEGDDEGDADPPAHLPYTASLLTPPAPLLWQDVRFLRLSSHHTRQRLRSGLDGR